jgi:hypothetical protein
MNKKINVGKYMTVVPVVLAFFLIRPLSVIAGGDVCPCFNTQVVVGTAQTSLAQGRGGLWMCNEHKTFEDISMTAISPEHDQWSGWDYNANTENLSSGTTFACSARYYDHDKNSSHYTNVFHCDMSEADCHAIAESCYADLDAAAQILLGDPEFNNYCSEN